MPSIQTSQLLSSMLHCQCHACQLFILLEFLIVNNTVSSNHVYKSLTAECNLDRDAEAMTYLILWSSFDFITGILQEMSWNQP